MASSSDSDSDSDSFRELANELANESSSEDSSSSEEEEHKPSREGNEPAKPPPAKRMKYDLKTTFSVEVGKDLEGFTVHHDLITQRSEFFRISRLPQWKQPGEPTTLLDDEPNVFSLYMHCLYFGTYDLGKRIDTDIAEAWNTEKDGIFSITLRSNAVLKQGLTMDLYINLYILADKLLDPSTSNLVINQLIVFSRKHRESCKIDPVTLAKIYDSTTDGSPLRKIVRDWLLSNDWVMQLPQGDCANLPLELLRDLITETSRLHKAHPHHRVHEVFRDLTISRPKGFYHQKVDQRPTNV